MGPTLDGPMPQANPYWKILHIDYLVLLSWYLYFILSSWSWNKPWALICHLLGLVHLSDEWHWWSWSWNQRARRAKQGLGVIFICSDWRIYNSLILMTNDVYLFLFSGFIMFISWLAFFFFFKCLKLCFVLFWRSAKWLLFQERLRCGST